MAYQNQKQKSNFKGLTLKVFKNKYKNKPTSYDFKGDGDEFFLKKLGQWLKSPEIKQERDNGKPLKVGVRMTEYNGNENCEITFYIGQPKQQTSNELEDDALPTDENGEDIF
tara:strand:+ start:178 stop:513 length:336 start_codon:yes stop_codon:yes gene_type:complete